MATGEPHHGFFVYAPETFLHDLSSMRGAQQAAPRRHRWHVAEPMGMVPERPTFQYSPPGVSFADHRDHSSFEEHCEEVAKESESPSLGYQQIGGEGRWEQGLGGKRPHYEDYGDDHGYSPVEDHHIMSWGIETTSERQQGHSALRIDTREEIGPGRKIRQHTKPLTFADLLIANGIPLGDDNNNEVKDNSGSLPRLNDSKKDGLAKTSTWQHKWRGRITKPLTYAELFLANGIAFKGGDDKSEDEEKRDGNVDESLSAFTTRCGRKTQPPKRFRRSGLAASRRNSEL